MAVMWKDLEPDLAVATGILLWLKAPSVITNVCAYLTILHRHCQYSAEECRKLGVLQLLLYQQNQNVATSRAVQNEEILSRLHCSRPIASRDSTL